MSSQFLVSGWNRGRLAAWFRDIQHRLDLMTVAVILNIDPRNLQPFVDQHAEAPAQAAYWNSLQDTSDLVQPTGTSDHNIATAFEINYFGAFRSCYLVATFGPNITRRVLNVFRDYNIALLIADYVPRAS